MCEHCQQLRDAVIALAEIVETHLRTYEAQQDYIAFGPEPSDRVNDIVRGLQGEVSA